MMEFCRYVGVETSSAFLCRSDFKRLCDFYAFFDKQVLWFKIFLMTQFCSTITELGRVRLRKD